MSIAHSPSVFVSSTCYDLAQVRQDLRQFIESLGMTPVLSEFDSFPVNPDLDAVGNCLAGVKDKADIFVLVVGGRYGSRVGGGKSVTNLEYIEAKAKGIPCYVFVHKPVLTTLPIWRKNPSGDFSDMVDSPQLFEFVDSLRDPKESWVFPFESAQDIVATLRTQFAYLFMDALSMRGKVLQAGLPDKLHNLSGAALLLWLEKPYAWECRLFSQILADELRQCGDLKRDIEYGLVLGRTFPLGDVSKFIDWVISKISEIGSFAASLTKLVNAALPNAVCTFNDTGDAGEIVYVARRLAQVYRRILEWSSEFVHAQVQDECARILAIISMASLNVIAEIEEFSAKLQQELREAASRYEDTKQPQSVRISLTLTSPDLSELDSELERIAELLGVDWHRNRPEE